MNPDTELIPFKKTSSKWITDQNEKCRTKDNRGEILDALRMGTTFKIHQRYNL